MYLAIRGYDEYYADICDSKEEALMEIIFWMSMSDRRTTEKIIEVSGLDIDTQISMHRDAFKKYNSNKDSKQLMDEFETIIETAMKLIEDGEFCKIDGEWEGEGEGFYHKYGNYAKIIEIPENAIAYSLKENYVETYEVGECSEKIVVEFY